MRLYTDKVSAYHTLEESGGIIFSKVLTTQETKVFSVGQLDQL